MAYPSWMRPAGSVITGNRTEVKGWRGTASGHDVAGGAAHSRATAAEGLRRGTRPAAERAMEGARFRIAKQERGFVDADRGLGQITLRQLPPYAVEQLREGRAFIAQAALERTLTHREFAADLRLHRLALLEPIGDQTPH